MVCKKCNTENPSENKMCSNCGARIKNTKKSAIHKFGGLFAVILLGFAIFAYNSGIFARKYEVEQSRAQHPIIYIINNTLGIKPIKKSATILSDYLLANPASGEQPKVFVAKNGESVFFLEGYDAETSTGSLFASFNGKTKIPVSAKTYNNIKISDNGKYALFIDLPEKDKNFGALYIYKKNSEKEKIADNVSLTEFGFSPDSQSIVYISQGDLYFQKIGSQREKIDSNVYALINVSASSSVLYTKVNSENGYDLYYWKLNKEAVLAGKNVSPNLVYTSGISDNFYYCCNSEHPSSYSLYYKAGKKDSQLIDTAVLSPIAWDSRYNNIVYMKNFSSDTFTSDTYVKLNGKNSEKLGVSADTSRVTVRTSYDFKHIAYLSDIDATTGLGKLYLSETGLFKDKEPFLVAENVYDFDFSKDAKVLLYLDSPNSGNTFNLHLYKNKTETMIAENVQQNSFTMTSNAKAVFYLTNYNAEKDSGNLFCKSLSNPKSESIKIDTEVTRNFCVRSHNQVIYTKNYSNDTGESDLYLWRGKKLEHIDKGVITRFY